MPSPLDAQILKYLRAQPGASSSQLVARFKTSRQTIAAHLTGLVHSGQITRTGSTKNARYDLAHIKARPKELKVHLIKSLKHLQEDRVFDEIDLRLNLKKHVSDNVYRILYYAFSEMLNNAIDHSAATQAHIDLALTEGKIQFTIRDHGIGAFANFQKKFKLQTEFEAIEHLLKGKQTTFPEQHSGQGIFFTSRIADRFILRSHRLELIVDNEKNDLFAGEKRNLKGTEVQFEIRKQSRKILKSLFDQYSAEDFTFDRANYRLKLTANRELLSRSQAKRIVTGLEAYRKIVFDFSGVAMIGQAFADEIFRVFQNRQPQMEITFSNANETVTAMILRVLRG